MSCTTIITNITWFDIVQPQNYFDCIADRKAVLQCGEKKSISDASHNILKLEMDGLRTAEDNIRFHSCQPKSGITLQPP